MSKSRFAVCLFQEHFKNIESTDLITGEGLVKVKTKSSGHIEFVVYQRQTDANEPAWIDIISKFATLSDAYKKSASAGAIMVIRAGGRVFGCCFGSSVSNIDRSNIESDFGLATVFSRMIKDKTKSIASFTLGANPITNNRSSAIPTTKDTFNVDDLVENITELSGFVKSKDTKKNNLIKGKEFYSSPLPLTLKKIHDLCKELLKDYLATIDSDEYKALTSTRKIKDKKTTDELNDRICAAIDKNDPMIELVDYEQLNDSYYYKFAQKGTLFETISIDDFYSEFANKQSVDLKYLKGRHIFVSDENNLALASWSFYKCLFVQFDLQHNAAILYRGSWYEIDTSYLSSLQSFIKTYEFDNVSDLLPAWDGNEEEPDYCKRAAKHVTDGQYWDRTLYTHQNFSYGIEFCDILSPNYIIHVKTGRKSSLNSHLLMQTLVSARLYKEDVGMRKWIYKKSKENHKKCLHLKKDGSAKKDDVSYLIVLLTNDDKPVSQSLPFFSLISFNMIIKQISQLGLGIQVGVI